MKSEAATTEAAERTGSRVAQVLDELVASLRAKDRELVLLRFYQGKSMTEIGAVLGISDDAARKRVAYVIDKLRRMLRGRGVRTSSDLALGSVMANLTHASPAVVKAAALGAGATRASADVLALAKGVTMTMLMAKVKVLAAVTVVALAVGAAAAIAMPLILAQATPAPASNVAATAPGSLPAAANSEDDVIAPFLNARTNMLDAIDPFAIDWDAVDAARDQLQGGGRGGGNVSDATQPPDEPRIVPTFSRHMTAMYRRWTADFRNAGGKRIYLISQVGAEKENPGAFTVFSMADGADPARFRDVCTPSSYSAQQIYETRIVGRTLVAANHRMVTALPTGRGQPRPDILEALRATRMPVRMLWLPQQCRLGGTPSVSGTSIDSATATVFRGREWDKVLWVIKGYAPPPTRAAEIIIKCRDAAAARTMRDWVAEQAVKHKRAAPTNSMDFGATLSVDAANDQVRLVIDPTPSERIWFLGNTFNVAP